MISQASRDQRLRVIVINCLLRRGWTATVERPLEDLPQDRKGRVPPTRRKRRFRLPKSERAIRDHGSPLSLGREQEVRAGTGGITCKLLGNMSNKVQHGLLDNINKVWESSQLPAERKEGEVRFIRKPGKPLTIKNMPDLDRVLHEQCHVAHGSQKTSSLFGREEPDAGDHVRVPATSENPGRPRSVELTGSQASHEERTTGDTGTRPRGGL